MPNQQTQTVQVTTIEAGQALLAVKQAELAQITANKAVSDANFAFQTTQKNDQITSVEAAITKLQSAQA